MSTNLEKIIDWFGSQSEMARKLQVDRSAVSQWVNAGKVPAMRAIQIESLSNGLFKAVDIAELPNQ